MIPEILPEKREQLRNLLIGQKGVRRHDAVELPALDLNLALKSIQYERDESRFVAHHPIRRD